LKVTVFEEIYNGIRERTIVTANNRPTQNRIPRAIRGHLLFPDKKKKLD
jgi:hypothetical protein